MSDRKFTTMYTKYQTASVTTNTDAFNKIVDAIQKHDYAWVGREMTLLKIGSDEGKYFFW